MRLVRVRFAVITLSLEALRLGLLGLLGQLGLLTFFRGRLLFVSSPFAVAVGAAVAAAVGAGIGVTVFGGRAGRAAGSEWVQCAM